MSGAVQCRTAHPAGRDTDSGPETARRLEAADIPLLLAALAIPLLPTLMGGLPMKAMALETLAFATLLMLPWIRSGFAWRLRSPAHPLDRWILLWLLVAAAGIAKAHLPSITIYDFGHVLALAVLYYGFTTRVRSMQKALAFFLAASCSALAVALVELYGFYAGAGRQTGSVIFLHSYLAAQFLLPVSVMILSIAVNRGLLKCRCLAALASMPIMAYLFIIGSRGAYLTFLTAMAFLLGLAILRFRSGKGLRHPGRAAWLAISIVLTAALLLFILSGAGVLGEAGKQAVERVESLLDPARAEFNFSRIQVWKDALRMSRDSLLLGVGQGNFALVFPAYHQEIKPISHAHNQFLQILCENGVPGLLCFLVILARLFRRIRRESSEPTGDDLSFALKSGAAGALVAAGIYCLFETPLEWPASASFFLLPVSILLLRSPEEREPPGAPSSRWPWFALAAVATAAWIFPAAHMVRTVPSSVLGERGHALFEEGRFSEAAEMLRAASEAWPCRPDIFHLEAQALYQCRRPEAALEAAKKSLKLRPEASGVLAVCGRCLMRLGRFEEAREYLRAAMLRTRYERAQQIFFEMGRAYRLSGSLEAALNIFEYLYQRHPASVNMAGLHLEIACTLIQLKRDSDLAAAMLEASFILGGSSKDRVILLRIRQLIEDMGKVFELTPGGKRRLDRLKERVEEALESLEEL